jgi:hypothetical protein
MILKKPTAVFLVVVALWIARAATFATAQRSGTVALSGTSDARFVFLFTPSRPVLGRYEVLVDRRAITDLTSGPIETLDAVDAFGTAGPYDRAALVRLYRGRRAQVSRSWTAGPDVRDSRFESVTLISPYPDPSFRQLVAGTLVIRWICEEACRSAKAFALH